MKNYLKYISLAIFMASISTGQMAFASELKLEDKEQSIQTSSVVDDLDEYERMDLGSFDDVVDFTMEDVKVLDTNASELIGEYAKLAVERRLGRFGKAITTTTGLVAKFFGKKTLTECALVVVRQPFVIEGEYPKSMPELFGLKAQLGVQMLPYVGKTAVVLAKKVAALKGKQTLTEVIVEKLAYSDKYTEDKE